MDPAPLTPSSYMTTTCATLARSAACTTRSASSVVMAPPSGPYSPGLTVPTTLAADPMLKSGKRLGPVLATALSSVPESLPPGFPPMRQSTVEARRRSGEERGRKEVELQVSAGAMGRGRQVVEQVVGTGPLSPRGQPLAVRSHRVTPSDPCQIFPVR
jgi:hypothetical protein